MRTIEIDHDTCDDWIKSVTKKREGTKSKPLRPAGSEATDAQRITMLMKFMGLTREQARRQISLERGYGG